ncbi:MAG TPA: exodeoxyribonuclease VII large subunit [Mariprofundaceae bacterium]|nr:exodeoxyribonuclease VII large subunit [Mariprofundaceae bacterium]
MSATPISVTELTARIKTLLEQGFAHVEVCGEVSRLTSPASGHLYFTIKDQHAAIAAVVWRSAALRLKTRPEEGREFIFSGHLSVYEPRGSYQLVVTRIEEAGAGRLAAEFEKRKQLFAERGWFDPARKRATPRLPRHIGIVTSATAAAFEDVKKVLATRPGWLRLTLSPCLVQGAEAPASIAAAFARLIPQQPDVILLVRGGGSMEDLWCFNDETVVKAIVDCPLPVISGIGHEIDVTLADFAADLRAATPSNAAELACPSRDELRQQLPRLPLLSQLICHRLDDTAKAHGNLAQRSSHAIRRGMDGRLHASAQALNRLSHAGKDRLTGMRRGMRALATRLTPLEPGRQLRRQRQSLTQLRTRIEGIGNRGLRLGSRTLAPVTRRLAATRRGIVPGLERSLAGHEHRLHTALAEMLAGHRHHFDLLVGKLQAMGPEQVLERGYTLAYAADGRLLTRATQLHEGDAMQVQFHDGTANARVETIEVERP